MRHGGLFHTCALHLPRTAGVAISIANVSLMKFPFLVGSESFNHIIRHPILRYVYTILYLSYPIITLKKILWGKWEQSAFRLHGFIFEFSTCVVATSRLILVG